MKTITLGAACAFIVLSCSAVAADAAGDHAKPTMEEQCRAMGEQHGMKEDKMDAWMKKCMEISRQQMKEDTGGNDSGMDDMEDPQDGDQDMSHDMSHD